MRGLYINCSASNVPTNVTLAQKYSETYLFPNEIGNGFVIYNPNEWNSSPTVTIDGNTFVITGWFIYKKERNNLNQLALDILKNGIQVVNEIQSGSFLIYWWNGSLGKLIVDPLGMSTHFMDKYSQDIRIAPSVKALYSSEKHPKNELLQSVLNKKNHLFGNFTIFDGIERLEPGAIIQAHCVEKYWKLKQKTNIKTSDLGNLIRNTCEYWDEDSRLLPLSSGLDSRYLLANGSYFYGFTYGPDKSPEINIASSFKSEFNEYHTFGFNTPPLNELEKGILEECSFGWVTPIPRLLTSYIHVKNLMPKANVLFEGYLGDVFQRGTFITFKGKLGELFKIFPVVYSLFNFDAEFLLRRRYIELNSAEFDILLNDFLSKTKQLELNDYQKVTYYEFLYGRGGRYAIFGSNILAAQVFTVVSPFTHNHIFSKLITQDFRKAVSYRTMKHLWSKTSKKFKVTKIESGYTPSTCIYFIPFIQIFYRLMFHVLPSRANYGIKQKRLEKANSRKHQ